MGSGTSVMQHFSTNGTGEIAGNTSSTQAPDRPAKMVKFKAPNDNAGTVAIGTESGVTLPDGSEDETAGFPLEAGDETAWLPCPDGNLDDFFYISENAGDDLTYIILT